MWQSVFSTETSIYRTGSECLSNCDEWETQISLQCHAKIQKKINYYFNGIQEYGELVWKRYQKSFSDELKTKDNLSRKSRKKQVFIINWQNIFKIKIYYSKIINCN